MCAQSELIMAQFPAVCKYKEFVLECQVLDLLHTIVSLKYKSLAKETTWATRIQMVACAGGVGVWPSWTRENFADNSSLDKDKTGEFSHICTGVGSERNVDGKYWHWRARKTRCWYAFW